MFYRLGQHHALAALGLEKLAAILRPGIGGPAAEIQRHIDTGNFAEASRLARQPGAFVDQQHLSPFDLGHHIRHLGAGVEGSAELMVHPQHGVNATKIYDPRGITKRRGVELKGEAFNRIQNFEPRSTRDRELQQRLVRLLGQTTPPRPTDAGIPTVLPAHHFEFVPGHHGGHVLPADQEDRFTTLQGQMRDFIPRATGGMTVHDTNKRDNWIIGPDGRPTLVDFSLTGAPGASWGDIQQKALPGADPKTIFARHREGFDSAEPSDDPRYAEPPPVRAGARR